MDKTSTLPLFVWALAAVLTASMPVAALWLGVLHPVLHVVFVFAAVGCLIGLYKHFKVYVFERDLKKRYDDR